MGLQRSNTSLQRRAAMLTSSNWAELPAGYGAQVRVACGHGAFFQPRFISSRCFALLQYRRVAACVYYTL